MEAKEKRAIADFVRSEVNDRVEEIKIEVEQNTSFKDLLVEMKSLLSTVGFLVERVGVSSITEIAEAQKRDNLRIAKLMKEVESMPRLNKSEVESMLKVLATTLRGEMKR